MFMPFSAVHCVALQMQKAAAACGTIYLDVESQNYTISISSNEEKSNLECQSVNTISSARLRELPLLCHRCPTITGGMAYTVFVVGRSENKLLSKMKYVEVS